MSLRKYEDLPDFMKCKDVREYYEIIKEKKIELFAKRIFDILGSLIGIVVLMPIMLIIAVLIKFDSPGPVIFKQNRITQYGRQFKILKFRTMFVDAEAKGSQVTVENDSRVTSIGKILRKYRLDELPQIFNILCGDLSFVGTRPEVFKYVSQYTPNMLATLLLPSGVTSEASIKFKDEEKMLKDTDDIDFIYMTKVLPIKMRFNLEYVKKFSIYLDLKIMILTLVALFKSDNREVETISNNEVMR